MPASREFALSSEESLLIWLPGWIGDNVMAMPAVQLFRELNPDARLTLFGRPTLLPLWDLFDVGLKKIAWPATASQAISLLARGSFTVAVLFPNSFRSAWYTFCARIPRRRGYRGHWRRWLLTEVVQAAPPPPFQHQVFEYAALLVPSDRFPQLRPISLRPPVEVLEKASARWPRGTLRRIALLPGAARGPAKRWPAAHFAELGRRLSAQGQIVVLGSPAERELCEQVATGIGSAAMNLAGMTSLTEFAALLHTSDLAVANDSGGAHLAVALGVPTVVIVGATDPAKTAPWGPSCRVISAGENGKRAVRRTDPAAIKKLASIPVERVYEAALQLLKV